MDKVALDIAVIGGGFSGLMVLHHLAREGRPGDRYAIFEPRPLLGQGVAYGTNNPAHLLNAPVGRMSAIPEEPDDFLHWLQTDNTKWTAAAFAPRMLYARYLEDISQKTFALAAKKNIAIHHIRSAVHDLTPQQNSVYRIEDGGGAPYEARQIILALGNQETASENNATFVRDIWNFDYQTLRGNPGPVAILGAGLSMVDTVLSLRHAGYAGKIIAASRRGLLPRVHDGSAGDYDSAADALAQQPNDLTALMYRFRQEIKICAARNISWQRVVDSWRSRLPALWAGLSMRQPPPIFRPALYALERAPPSHGPGNRPSDSP